MCHPLGVITHGRAPSWMNDAGGEIYEWKLLEAIIEHCLVIRYTENNPVILFVDNQDAQAALISGGGESDISAQICAAFGALAASVGVNVWIEYVPSRLNIADAPSRARNVPRGDSEITNSFENIPLPMELWVRVQAPIHLSKARYGEDGCFSLGFPTLCLNFEHKANLN